MNDDAVEQGLFPSGLWVNSMHDIRPLPEGWRLLGFWYWCKPNPEVVVNDRDEPMMSAPPMVRHLAASGVVIPESEWLSLNDMRAIVAGCPGNPLLREWGIKLDALVQLLEAKPNDR